MCSSSIKILPVFALLVSTALGDIISGVVTDRGDNTPLAGVKVSLDADHVTFSEEDGSYSLNNEATGISRPNPIADVFWDAATGSFVWDRSRGRVVIEVRNIRGDLVVWHDFHSDGTNRYHYQEEFRGIHFVSVITKSASQFFKAVNIDGMIFMKTVYPGLSPVSGPLAKRAAINFLTYEKEDYVSVVEEVDGSRDDVDVSLTRIDTSGASWRQANLTWFTSYPDPGSEECIEYNGCLWAGYFAGVNGQQTEEWVAAHNIAAVHSRDFDTYRLKTLRLRQGEHQIDVTVYDMCSDNDCSGCCTRNASETGFLIDVETYTAERFGVSHGVVDWICLDCGN
jgi:hypothetical protein